MTRRTLTRVGMTLGLTVLAAGSLALASHAANAGDREDRDTAAALRALRLRSDGMNLVGAKATTAKYRSVARAVADGYIPTGACVAAPAGGVGYRYVNPKLAGDSVVEPTRPEVLLFAPGPSGKPQLVGLEFWKTDGDQNLGTSDDRPAMFGQRFEGPMQGHKPGMPIHYDLRVWLWKKNPKGLFAQFNPQVRCT